MKALAQDVYEYFPNRVSMLCVLMVTSGVLEGLVLLLLLPFLKALIGTDTTVEDPVSTHLIPVLESVGIEPSAITFSIVLLLAALIQYGTRIGQSYLSAQLQSEYIAQLRKDLFARLVDARWSFFLRQKSGEYTNSITLEAARAATAFTIGVQLLASIVIAIIFLGLSFYLSWEGTVLLVVTALCIGLCSYRVIRTGHSVGAQLSDLGENLAGWGNEVFSNMKIFKASGSDRIAVRHFESIIDRMHPLFFWSWFSPALVRSILEFLALGALIGFLVLGVAVLEMDFALLLVIVGIFVRLLPRMSMIQENLQTLNVHLPAVRRLREMRNRAAEAGESPQVHETPKECGNCLQPVQVRIRDLTVQYGDQAVLERLSLVVESGEFVAIVGPSGAGKTTLVDCILGLVEPTDGTVEIDGVSLSRSKLWKWRREVGYQAQDSIILNATIRENISWSEGNASQERIVEAARKVGVNEFIESLQHGYETGVGEKGGKLSGGQRQRIGLARVLLSNKRLLLLDEATSALDANTERHVIDSVRSLKGGMTILMVTHRLASTRDADRIYVLEDGKLVQSGIWNDLVEQDGAFRNLWTQQGP